MENRSYSTNNIEEWINGIKFMSPRPQLNHVAIQGHLFMTLRNYFKGSCMIFSEPDTFLSTEDVETLRNDSNKLKALFKNKKANVVPDIVVVCDKRQMVLKGVIGIPSLIIEILSPSNSSSDTITKFNLYKEYGVPEYWIIDPMTKMIFIWTLEDGTYKLKVECSFDSKFLSPRFEDLEVDLSLVELIEDED